MAMQGLILVTIVLGYLACGGSVPLLKEITDAFIESFESN
jgi:hypothetical protein